MAGGATACREAFVTVALTKPWTRERCLAWNDTQEQRHALVGMRPAPMTGGSANHNRLAMTIHAGPRAGLRGTPCSCFALDVAVRTIGDNPRFPDVLATRAPFPSVERIAPDPVIIFEAPSPESGRRDRIERPRE
jgi:hypothetical protein